MPLMQQILTVITPFYDAPARPVGVFDDFLAIPTVQGNVSVMPYSVFILSTSSLVPTISTRLVIRNPVDGKETDMIPNL
jgi:hypothetical protein